MATWKQLKHIMTHFRLFAEWEQTCDMRGGGGLRHPHSASQTRLRFVSSSSELFYLGGEIYFLIVCQAIDAQPAEAIANVVA